MLIWRKPVLAAVDDELAVYERTPGTTREAEAGPVESLGVLVCAWAWGGKIYGTTTSFDQ